jgi:hypothetical protein
LSDSISKSWLASNRSRRIRNSSDRAQLTFGFGAVAVSYSINALVINECTCGYSVGSLLANTSGSFLSCGGARVRARGTRVGNLAGVAPLASSGGCASGGRRGRAAARRSREESKVASWFGSVTTSGGGVRAGGSRSVTGIFPITSVVGGYANSSLRKSRRDTSSTGDSSALVSITNARDRVHNYRSWSINRGSSRAFESVPNTATIA